MGKGCFLVVLFVLACPVHAEVHEKVRAALDWELPVNECQKPILKGVSATSMVTSTIPGYTDGNSKTNSVDVDRYTLDRHERKMRRWNKCVLEYKAVLTKDFEELKNSAQYGLTQEQANNILGKMKHIQLAQVSPNGLPEEQAAVEKE